MKKTSEICTHSEQETYDYAYHLGHSLSNPAVITLSGDLGAGKTVFVRGLAAGAAAISPREVSSPTFTYLHIYTGQKTLYHFDLYRLKNSHEFLSAGFADYLQAGEICCIEWADRIASILSELSLPNWIHINIAYADAQTRILTLS